MKLALLALVRDEADIIERMVLFHLEHGVDFAIVTDNGSKDGTRDLLARLEEQYPEALTVLDEPADTFEYATWMGRMVERAREQRRAEWLLPADADEFWVAADGEYRTEMALPTTLITAHWRNMLPVEGLPWPEFSQVGEMQGYDRWTPKVAVRADAVLTIWQGGHEASVSPTVGLESANLCLYHYPIRSYEQFERKVVNMVRATLKNPATRDNPIVNWHTRLWYEGHLAGRLREVYAQVVAGAQNVTPDDTMRRLLAR